MQVRCQGESTYILEEDIEECFRTGRGLALTLGGPRVLIGSELGHEPEEPDHPTSGEVHQCNCGALISVDVMPPDFEGV